MTVILFGLLLGSFLNCFVYRTVLNKTLLGRSQCPYCDTKLSANDLIPVLSYVFLKGNCRYCKAKISAMYPILELLYSGVFYYLYYHMGLTWSFAIISFLAFLIIAIALTDAITGYIYDLHVWGCFLAMFLYHFINNTFSIYLFISALSVGLFFLLIYKIGRFLKYNWLGSGDILFRALLAFILGVDFYIVVFVITTLLEVVFLIIREKTWKIGNIYLPQAPFETLALLIFLLI